MACSMYPVWIKGSEDRSWMVPENTGQQSVKDSIPFVMEGTHCGHCLIITFGIDLLIKTVFINKGKFYMA